MSKRAYENMKKLRALLEQDGEYLELERRRRETEPEFQEVMKTLPREQEEIIFHYLSILQEQGLREIELACFLPAG